MIQKITPRQKKHVLRFMEDALDATETDKEGVQQLVKRGGEFKDELSALIGRYTSKAPDYALVRAILGDDFISPVEIATARNLVYTDEQIAELERTLPDRETLEWLRRNDFMLVAGSPREMSLLDIRELERSYFSEYDRINHDHTDVTLRCDEKVTCRWYKLRKDAVLGSMYATWSAQQNLLSVFETVPTAVELVWTLTCYKAVRNVYLLAGYFVRTLSVGSCGNHAYVSGYDGVGLGVLDWDDDFCGMIGLASSRK